MIKDIHQGISPIVHKSNMRGLFVATDYALASTPGGQQLCTQEYLAALQCAGIALETMKFKAENSLKYKVLRRIDVRPYRYFLPNDLAGRVVQRADQTKSTHIFLNTVDLAPLGWKLKKNAPALQVVLLSHGLESVDYIHTLRTQRGRSDFAGLQRNQVHRLGRQLIEECRQRAHIDAVLCLAAFEAEIERWLGARRVLVVPRTIKRANIEWTPISGRIGFVGRLDHPPNREGLVEVLDKLASSAVKNVDVRIAGAPLEIGKNFAKRWPFVTYLGVISDHDLLREAGTWTCAMNPIFCFARGASTKLAIMAAWGIPLVTTPAGARGYEWRQSGPVICDTPREIAATVFEISTNESARTRAREQCLQALKQALSIEDVAGRIRRFLAVSSGGQLL